MALFLAAAAYCAAPLHSGFAAPTGIAVDAGGALYVADWSRGTVEKIAPDGGRSVLAAGLPAPAGLAVAGDGAVYVATYSGHYLARIDRDGTVTRVASDLSTPTGLFLLPDGQLLVANQGSGEIVRVDPATGGKTTLASGLSLPVGVVAMPDGSLVASQYGGRVTRILPDGSFQELGEAFVRPGVGIVADGDAAVLVVDNGAGMVRRVDFSGRAGIVADGFSGSLVALARGGRGELLIGAWGSGHVYSIDYAQTK